MTLNQVIKRIQTIALAHKQVRSFGRGLITDFLTDKTTKYAAIFLQDDGGLVSTAGHATTLRFKMFFVDLVHVSEGTNDNQLDVQSDMVGVAMDIMAQMNFGTYTDWAVSTDNNLQLVYEENDDLYAGCILDLSIRIMFEQNVCQVPTDLPDYSPTDTDMKTVYDEIYVATGAEGLVLTIPALAGKRILLLVRDNNTLYKVSNLPGSTEYTWDLTGLGLGTATRLNERFLILYRSY